MLEESEHMRLADASRAYEQVVLAARAGLPPLEPGEHFIEQWLARDGDRLQVLGFVEMWSVVME
jgi:hypothetical protein